jgi:hypothetical protein
MKLQSHPPPSNDPREFVFDPPTKSTGTRCRAPANPWELDLLASTFYGIRNRSLDQIHPGNPWQPGTRDISRLMEVVRARTNFYPVRGDARATFRYEIRVVWTAIMSCDEPIDCGWAYGLWVLDDEFFLVHTRKLAEAMRTLIGCQTRRKSSVNAMLCGQFGCHAVEGGQELLCRIFLRARGSGREQCQWTLRKDSHSLFGDLPRPGGGGSMEKRGFPDGSEHSRRGEETGGASARTAPSHYVLLGDGSEPEIEQVPASGEASASFCSPYLWTEVWDDEI